MNQIYQFQKKRKKYVSPLREIFLNKNKGNKGQNQYWTRVFIGGKNKSLQENVFCTLMK